MKCELCEKRQSFHEHHFEGEDIDLSILSEDETEKYKELQKEREKLNLCVLCHSKIHGNIAKWNPIKMLYKIRKDLIEERKAIQNKIRNLKQYELDVSDLEEVKQSLMKKIEGIDGRLKDFVREEQIWKWLEKIYGISEINAAGLIATIGDISRFDTVSDVWAFFGLRPKSSFNFDESKWKNYEHYRQATKENRTLAVYDIGEQFLRKDSFYRQFYNERRKETEADERFGDPEENKGHYYSDARRVATKKFLSHLYEMWRRIEGLEVRKPYILADKHHKYIKPPYLDETLEELEGGD